MAQITVKSDEHFDKAIQRFKRVCRKEGIVTEARKRRYYEKPSDRRRRLQMKQLRKIQKKREQNKQRRIRR